MSNDGSTLKAGGTVHLVATGSGAKDANGLATDGDINAIGTQISGHDVVLNAARDINLQSAKDTSQQSGSNSSSGGSIGVGAALGGQQNGFTIELSANAARGDLNGNGSTNRDTQINATDKVSITSGRDTNVRGAEVAGNTVDANVGRDLNIASQQDTNSYDSKQTSAGFQASICVPPICYGTTVSGSASASDQTIKDSFQSVNQQSGFFAGNGGYNINVGNHTQLDGGVIASTATADKNALSTQTLGYTNLENHAEYSGSTLGFSASGSFGQSTPNGVNLNTPVKQAGSNKPGPQNSQGFGPSGFGMAGTGDSASGTTYAAVSPGTITVRGDAGTGQDSTAGLSRDTANANGAVQNTFDAQKVQTDMAIQQATVQVGMQVVGDVATALLKNAEDQAKKAQARMDAAQAAGDDAGVQQAKTDLDAAKAQLALWGNDGAGRIGAHAVVAGLGAALGGGNVLGAVGGTVAGDVAGNAASGVLPDSLGGNILSNVVSGAAGAAVGGALGGSSGAMSGANGALGADLFNRQLHPDEKKAIAEKANGDKAEETRLTQAACYEVQCWAEYSPNSDEYAANYVSPQQAAQLGPELQWVKSQSTSGGLFIYTLPQQWADSASSQTSMAVRGAQNLADQFATLMKRDAQGKIAESPINLIVQGAATGLGAIAGWSGFEPPTGTALAPVKSAGGQVTSAPTLGQFGYVPSNTIFNNGNDGQPSASSGTPGDLESAANQPFKDGQAITNAGRAVTKHPEYFGFDSTPDLRQVYRSDSQLNELAAQAIQDILENGTKTTGAGGRYPNGWITYSLPDGRAASWTTSGDFIGFRGLQK